MEPEAISPVVLIGAFVLARSMYLAVVRSYDEWTTANPVAMERLESAIAMTIVGAVVGALGVAAWALLADTDAKWWKIASNLATVVGLVTVVVNGFRWHNTVTVPPPGIPNAVPQAARVAVVFPGMKVVGLAKPDSITTSWQVQGIDASTVVLQSQSGGETYQMTRRVFEAAMAAGALTVA
jgi:hypothetical protein